jgi:hypothetical protein
LDMFQSLEFWTLLWIKFSAIFFLFWKKKKNRTSAGALEKISIGLRRVRVSKVATNGGILRSAITAIPVSTVTREPSNSFILKFTNRLAVTTCKPMDTVRGVRSVLLRIWITKSRSQGSSRLFIN